MTELKVIYGSPRLNNKDDPLDELFFIILSQMTTAPSYERVFERLKATLGNWDRLLSIPIEDLKSLVADAGLSNQKAPRLVAIASRLRADFGHVTLEPLRNRSDRAVEAYLVSLPAVGVKTAKCVMMYAMDRKVLPVDTHVARVAQRLGLIPDGTPAAQVHDVLERVVAPRHRYDFHVNAIAHGRAVCRAKGPKCYECPIRALCPSATSSRCAIANRLDGHKA